MLQEEKVGQYSIQIDMSVNTVAYFLVCYTHDKIFISLTIPGHTLFKNTLLPYFQLQRDRIKSTPMDCFSNNMSNLNATQRNEILRKLTGPRERSELYTKYIFHMFASGTPFYV